MAWHLADICHLHDFVIVEPELFQIGELDVMNALNGVDLIVIEMKFLEG